MSGKQHADPLEHVSLPKLLFWSLLLYLAWHWRALSPVLFNGELPGPDDFLRLHQAKNWWLGQDWYDLKVDRLIGNNLHWSRIIDFPLALIAAIVSWVADATTAWRIAAIIWPLALFLATILVLARLCDHLVGEKGRLLVLLFAGLNSFTMTEFAPGRIDHHNLQILLLIVCLASLFLKNPMHLALGVGISIALSVSIGLEILVLFVPVLGGLALMWAFSANGAAAALIATGMVLIAACLLLFGLTVPPAEYFSQYCDANSIVYLSALCGISIAFILLGYSQSMIDDTEHPNPTRRLIAGCLVAGFLVMLLVVLFPHCLVGPMGDIGPELKSRWLDNVVEAHGLITTVNLNPERWLSGVAYLVLMLGAALLVMRKQGRSMPQLWILFAVLVICAFASLWQMRVLRTGIFSAIPFCVMFAITALGWIKATVQNTTLRRMTQLFACVALTSYFWSLAALPFATTPELSMASNSGETQSRSIVPLADLSLRNPGVCFGARDMAELAALPEGLVMADLNLGPVILAHTPHRTISGPYHRNEEAILAVYDFFQSSSQEAHARARTIGVDYVVSCRIDSGIGVLDPQHMNARLLRNDLPDWLERKSTAASRLSVLQVVKYTH